MFVYDTVEKNMVNDSEIRRAIGSFVAAGYYDIKVIHLIKRLHSS